MSGVPKIEGKNLTQANPSETIFGSKNREFWTPGEGSNNRNSAVIQEDSKVLISYVRRFVLNNVALSEVWFLYP